MKNSQLGFGIVGTGMIAGIIAEAMTFVPTPSNIPGEVAMIQTFAEVAASGNAARRAAFVASSLKTQEYLDAIWVTAGS